MTIVALLSGVCIFAPSFPSSIDIRIVFPPSPPASAESFEGSSTPVWRSGPAPSQRVHCPLRRDMLTEQSKWWLSTRPGRVGQRPPPSIEMRSAALPPQNADRTVRDNPEVEPGHDVSCAMYHLPTFDFEVLFAAFFGDRHARAGRQCA